jgi:dethiobiotin synthetase
MNGIFVTGTDTDVGKTWVGTHLIRELIDRGIDVHPRKPIESGWPTGDLQQTDAWRLALAAGKTDQLDAICPNRFAAALSPVRAARMEGAALTLRQLADQCTENLKSDDFLYVEGAGGFYSPLTEDALNADLASALRLPVVLVANNRLGCMSQVLLCCEALQRRGLDLLAVVLNQVNESSGDAAMNNQEDLAELLPQPVFSLTHNQSSLPAPLIDLLY